MKNTIHKMYSVFRSSNVGQALVEYVLILAVFSLFAIMAIPSFEDSVGNAFITSETTVTEDPPPPDPTPPPLTPCFDVIYHQNGGEGELPETQSYPIWSTVTVENATMTKAKHRFMGWSTNPTSAAADYVAGNTFIMPTHDVDLYAVYVPLYDVAYHNNGGSGDVPATTSYVAGDSVIVQNALLTKAKHRFIGWSTNPSSTTANYVAGNTFIMPANDVDLYAVFEPLYDVTYHSNGGTGSVPAAASYPAGGTVTVQNASLTKEKHRFIGWSRNSASTTAEYVAGNTFVMPAGNVDLYAVYERLYDVYYHANGGSGTVPTEGSHSVGDTITVKSASLTKTNYKFIGWSENPNSMTSERPVNSTFTMPAADVHLYAVYQLNQFTVTYYANGGSGTPPAAAKYTVGATVTVQNASLTKTNYQFVGWATSSSSLLVDYAVGSSFTMPSNDVDLYAVYMRTEFPYKGYQESLMAPVAGTYQIQLWGARGGSSKSNGVSNDSAGSGYTLLYVNLTRGQTIYFAVGGKGTDNAFTNLSNASGNSNAGGWNGGGNGWTDGAADEGSFTSNQREGNGGGGGATSVYTTLIGDGRLANYSGSTGSILGVAGGSAGASYSGTTGYGGGATGGGGTLAGTQSSGNAFGVGQSATGSRTP